GPSRRGDHAAPGTRPDVFHTTLNGPSALISPMNTGLLMWWLGNISAVPPVRFATLMPGSVSITLSGLVVPAFFTASTHMWKPMTGASIGALGVRFGFLVNALHFAMNCSLLLSLSLIDWK